MQLKYITLMVSLLSPLVFVTPRAIAGETYDHDQEHRQYEAHAHGVAALNLVPVSYTHLTLPTILRV